MADRARIPSQIDEMTYTFLNMDGSIRFAKSSACIPSPLRGQERKNECNE